MGITLKQSIPKDKPHQPEGGLAPSEPSVPKDTTSKVLRACFYSELQCFRVVWAVTDVFSDCSPLGRMLKWL